MKFQAIKELPLNEPDNGFVKCSLLHADAYAYDTIMGMFFKNVSSYMKYEQEDTTGMGGEPLRRYTGELVVMHMSQVNHIIALLDLLKKTAPLLPSQQHVIDTIRDEILNK